MRGDPRIDGLLVQWGDRLFYPGNRSRESSAPRLTGQALRSRANHFRERIAATVVRRAPQVMVKVTGGGRGMRAIAAHFRYISKNGRLEVEDEQGHKLRGKEAVKLMVEDWQWGGSHIQEAGSRREAFNIILSMPNGTDPSIVQRAAREFAQGEFEDHKYVMVLHDHQANPHVHLSVRAESVHGRRLNPRKADLARWRETFAEKLRGWGIEAEASRRGVRGPTTSPAPLWRLKAAAEGRLRRLSSDRPTQAPMPAHVLEAWHELARALSGSSSEADRRLGARLQQARDKARGPETREVGPRPVGGR
ncbi:relaxase/mobilization nuclease domain-containing protein [Piscinibacter sp. HJYY11]|uniref:relaxase/mobilization nuclease domain-containing protein n=1 Tax=Piscinibacter sp. HJYY11 TaxID=2801333 RepID=UPI00191D2668|nr:conjugal transfer protein TraS [Piscinibacter sp. HJYY11]MBL0726101.1 conjugal transfer protein TraS [Piscinibacter sp. HJYY11]